MDALGIPQEEMEELLKLLESYERSGKGFGNMPQELQDLLNNVRRSKGVPTGEAETTDITPAPGFVVKTVDQEGRKMFINICHSDKVPAPGGWTSGSVPDKVLKALEDLNRNQPSADAEALRFPLSCSEILQDADKHGQPCSTVDCMIHSDVLNAAQQHRPLKAFLVQLALDWVGSKHKLQLNHRFKLPKMTYKGAEVRSQRVRVDKKPLVTDVTAQQTHSQEPTFPLLPNKAAAQARSSSKSTAAAAAPMQPNRANWAQASSQQPQLVAAAAAAAWTTAGMKTGGATANSNSSKQWQHAITCEGRPVTQVIVTLQMPGWASHSANTAASSKDANSSTSLTAEVNGQQLRVQGAGQNAPYIVQLPFAVSLQGATAEYQPIDRQLEVKLPYLPMQQWVEQLVAQAPTAFAKLPVSHASYMELDDS